MDTKTGNIYPSHDAGMKDVIAQLEAVGVGEKEARRQARARLVTGPKPTLRKLQKMIRQQIVRERAKGKCP